MKPTIQLIILAAAVIAIALLTDAWRSARHDSQQLAATLASQNAQIKQDSNQEKQRNAQLASTLATIQSQKRSIHTPKQAAKQLPEVFPPLPLPVSIHLPDRSAPMRPANIADVVDPASVEAPVSVSIPQPDLIPLYNKLQDCRANQAQTSTLQKDLADEKAQAASLLRERDAAVATARGGTLLLRLKRAAKWFAIGAVAGAALAAAAHH